MHIRIIIHNSTLKGFYQCHATTHFDLHIYLDQDHRIKTSASRATDALPNPILNAVGVRSVAEKNQD